MEGHKLIGELKKLTVGKDRAQVVIELPTTSLPTELRAQEIPQLKAEVTLFRPQTVMPMEEQQGA